jgi:8-oxo-dGTP pyrophosphatase MutT (NUDIX family)
MDGRSNPQAAAREAYEEAGVVGKIASKPIGSFTYEKALKGTTQPAQFQVDVYPLHVDRQLTCWPEVHQRQTAWIEVGQTDMIANLELRHIIDQWLWSMESRPYKRATR